MTVKSLPASLHRQLLNRAPNQASLSLGSAECVEDPKFGTPRRSRARGVRPNVRADCRTSLYEHTGCEPRSMAMRAGDGLR